MSANRIQLDGDGYVKEEALAATGQTISPGMLVEKDSDGKFQVHSEEGGHSQVMVAVEDALQGETVDDDYTAGTLVTAHIQRRGTRFQGLVKSGEIISIGEGLISAGDGYLIAENSRSSDEAVKQVVAFAEEAATLTGSNAANTLVAMRAV